MKTIVIELDEGSVVNIHGTTDFVIVDWDKIAEGWPKPKLPEGYVYDEENNWVKKVK